MPESTGRPTSDGSSGSDSAGTEDLDVTTTDETTDESTDAHVGETAAASAKAKASGKTPAARTKSASAGPVVPPKAKAKAKVATAESRAATARARAVAPNPEWWVPVLVTLLVLGLAWIVIFYITQGAWPVAAFGYWNLVAGFALLIAGFGMAMRWR